MNKFVMRPTNNAEVLRSDIVLSNNVLVFGLREGKYLHVSEVASGVACDCVCPICGKKLIAKKGAVRMHHFAHADDSDNLSVGHAGALQTQLHIMAKELIATSCEFTIPEVQVIAGSNYSIIPARVIHVDKVYLEHRMGNFIPDVIIESGGKKLFIEIYVTHKVDQKKLSKIQSLGMSCIEVDLSGYRSGISMGDLQQELIFGTDHKQWLYNAYARDKERKLLSYCKKIPLVNSSFGPKTKSCPIFSRIDNSTSNSYAYVHIDCLACPNLVNLSEKSDYNLFRDYIYCAAK